MKKKGYYKTNICAVYENPGDEEADIAPLFTWEIEIKEIDTTRVDMSKVKATINYELIR